MNKMAIRAKSRNKSINENFSYIIEPISIKLHRQFAKVSLYQNGWNSFAPMNKTTARVKKDKYFKWQLLPYHWVNLIKLHKNVAKVSLY